MKTIAKIGISLLLVATIVATIDKVVPSFAHDGRFPRILWLSLGALPLCISVMISFWLRTFVAHCFNGAVLLIYPLLWILWVHVSPYIVIGIVCGWPVLLALFGFLWGIALLYRNPEVA